MNMNECKMIEKCKLFKTALRNKPSIAELYLTRYCKSDYSTCARYVIYNDLGIKEVPNNLFPNQSEKIVQFKTKTP
jgi:hypothetical protein